MHIIVPQVQPDRSGIGMRQNRRGYDNLTPDHPALAVMTDFRLVPAATVTQQASLSKALDKMKPSAWHVAGTG